MSAENIHKFGRKRTLPNKNKHKTNPVTTRHTHSTDKKNIKKTLFPYQ